MNFSKTPPSTPGFYAWRSGPDGYVSLVDVYITEVYKDFVMTMNGRCHPISELGGEWCRLVPAEEIKEAYREGCFSGLHTTDKMETNWNNSRAKRVMEGKE